MATIKNIPPCPPDAVPVSGNPKYLVSKEGFVYDTDYRGRGVLAPICHVIAARTGYVKVSLLVEGQPKRKFTSVHRLVGEAYVPNPDPATLTDINHDDLNKQNNHFKNLIWSTHVDNIRHARSAKGNWCLGKEFTQPYLAYEFGNLKERIHVLRFPSLKAASIHFNKPYTTFAPLVNRAMKYQWKVCEKFWEKA